MEKKLNKNTKKAQYYINCFNSCYNYSLYGIYNNPSQRKITIATLLERDLSAMGYKDFRYLHGNCFNFVMGCRKNDVLRIETVGNSFIIQL